MSNLLAAFQSAGNALQQFEKAATVSENNVVNASTPGYAAQVLRLQSVAFDPDAGLYGGVQAGPVESARDEYAEAAVRRQASQQAFYSERSTSLSGINGVFDMSGGRGISTAMQNLFNSCGTWENSPNDASLRAAVVTAAQDVAASFSETASQLRATARDTTTHAYSLVDNINTIARSLADLNKQVRTSGDTGAAAETQVYAQLENLSSLTDFTIVRGTDNSFTVLLGGQVPLVVGDRSYQIKAGLANSSTPGAPPAVVITDASQTDVTGTIHSGQLAGAIRTVNGTIGSLLGNNSGSGSLNQLASSFANRVNQILASGVVDGTAAVPVSGDPLFSVASPGTAASSLSLTSGFTGSDLAAIDPGPPLVSNGIATRLANLGSSTDPNDHINGANYIDYYGSIVASVGTEVDVAQNSQTQFAQMAAQARSLRSELSGVSLDQEATKLVEFQRSYQAAARTVTVVNSMMDTLMNMLPGS